MAISYLKTLIASGLIIAASQGLTLRAQAEDARADYVAPLDMTSTYAGAIEYPEFLPDELYRRAMATPAETTGANSAPVASKQKNPVAENNNEINATYPDDIYKFAP